MNRTYRIYMRLLDKGVEVWRPVVARHLHENAYRILDQCYDREIETWEFEPGDDVICEQIWLYEGEVRAATRRAQ